MCVWKIDTLKDMLVDYNNSFTQIEVWTWDLWFDVPALLPAELSSLILAVPQIANYLCLGWGASPEAINPEMPCSRGSTPLKYDANNDTL